MNKFEPLLGDSIPLTKPYHPDEAFDICYNLQILIFTTDCSMVLVQKFYSGYIKIISIK